MGMTIPRRKDFLNPQIDVLFIISIFEKHASIDDKASTTRNHKLKLAQRHKTMDVEKCKVTSLHGCFSSSAWRSHHCLCHLYPPVRDNEWLACAFSGPSDLGKLHVALSESGRHFSALCLHHLLDAAFHVPAFRFMPSNLADLTPMPWKVCVASCL